MKRILIGSAAAISLLSVSGAMAADMAPRYTKAPVVAAAVYDWTGFYIGGNAGYSWGRGNTDQTDTASVTTNTRLFRGTTPPANEIIGVSPFNAPTGVFPQNTAAILTSGTSNRANVDGFIGGGQFGYNWQRDRWLAGLEADFQGSDERGSIISCDVVGCPVGSTVGSANYRLRWFGTARGRVGFLPTERLVLYATGGLGYGQLDVDYSSGINGSPLTATNVRTTRAGYVVGAGAEGAIGNNWSIKGEYLYMDLGSFSSNLGTGATATTATTTSFGAAGPVTVTTVTSSTSATVRSRFTDHIFRVGLNYRFGGPVVARY